MNLVGVQPFGSITFGAGHTHDPEMIIAGIGSSIEFRNVRHELYDRLHWVSFEYAMSAAVDLLRRRGTAAAVIRIPKWDFYTHLGIRIRTYDSKGWP